MAHHIAAFAVADCAPFDREARRHLSELQHRPVGHRCTKNHPGIPYIAGHHSRGIEPLIIIPQILDQLATAATQVSNAAATC